MTTESWTIDGSDGQPLYGDTSFPDGDPKGVVVVAHGFKGYKDYGMFPRIAEAAAGAGAIAHRFNFSHSGMTNAIETFERPDLFEADTWNRQVYDVGAIAGAIESGRLAGQGLPLVLFGHSRGGVTVLLAAGRGVVRPAGVATASAPHTCLSLEPEHVALLQERGYVESPSSRTGQTLRVGRVYLDEQRADPEAHDVLVLAGNIACPVLIVHGTDDPTVPAAAAEAIGAAATTSRVVLVEGGDHVFNTPNPMPEGAKASPQLAELLDALTGFCGECFGRR